jgi:threonylcarbamoyladenosine tRNA methylthiotransferase MtaB
VVVTGCYAQVASQEILNIAATPVCIVGNGSKHRLAAIAMRDSRCDLEMYTGDIGRRTEICPLTARRFPGRTRSYLKIQDGCNAFCTYCIVPYTRGRGRSLPLNRVLDQLAIFVEQDYKEIVLTGIHAGAYGRDLTPAMDFVELLGHILARGYPVRYRLSSLEPTEITPPLLELMATSPALTPHLHIPLQSGDNTILKAMNRRYTAEHFHEVISACATALPTAAIGIDVLAGFPGEDDQAFQHTLDLLTTLPVTALHAFPYSRRPGTVAAALPGQVPNQIKQERVARLRELDHKKRTAFYRKNLQTTHRVLVEGGTNQSGLMRGFTENYIPVCFRAPADYANQFVDVCLTGQDELTVYGEITGVAS